MKIAKPTDFYKENTTIGAIVTNGRFAQDEANKIASMARCAYARNIKSGRNYGGWRYDLCGFYGECACGYQCGGMLAAKVMSLAIERAVRGCGNTDPESGNCVRLEK
ncbi:MAG: hypothetical protein V8S31_03930 [Lachnospiraceae bacterium]